jgi:hypothetical protein
MGISDWDHDSGVIKEKLAKAYGRRPVEHDTAEATETISTKSSGFVLNIGADRKAELQAQLDQAMELQLHQAAADLSDSD